MAKYDTITRSRRIYRRMRDQRLDQNDETHGTGQRVSGDASYIVAAIAELTDSVDDLVEVLERIEQKLP